jgi:hypothetical protein
MIPWGISGITGSAGFSGIGVSGLTPEGAPRGRPAQDARSPRIPPKQHDSRRIEPRVRSVQFLIPLLSAVLPEKYIPPRGLTYPGWK